MPRRVLYVLHSFAHTGVETHCRDLARSLVPDYEAAFVFPHNDELIVVDANQRISARHPGERVSHPEEEIRRPRIEASLQRVVDDFRPDLVHVQHLLNWPLATLAQINALGVPVALTLHDYYVISPHYTLQGAPTPESAFSADYCQARFGRDIRPHLAKRRQILGDALRRVPLCIAPSRYLADVTRRIHARPIEVVDHGIADLPRLPRAHGARPLRFAYLGGMYEQKGWQPLLAAFAEVRARHGEAVELHLFGAGYPPEPPPHPGIVVHGVFEPKHLPEIMSQINVGVIPSLFAETFSLALSEFWHFGIPVAVADIGALGERVSDGVNGRKFVPGDVAGMAAVMAGFVESTAWHDWSLPVPRTLAQMGRDYRELYGKLLAATP